jgi:hypothetical protein
MSSRSLLALLAAAVVTTGCVAATDDAEEEDIEVVEQGIRSWRVNGRTPNAVERKWIRHVATEVVPHLSGSRGVRVRTAARVSFWSLKEGIFDLDNAHVFSNCNTSSGDRRIGPLDRCSPGRAWQVGLAAVQVPNQSLESVESVARRLFPGDPLTLVLRDAADEAGFARFGTIADAIASSGGSLRESWLLRRAPVGFTVVEDDIVRECISGSRSWCYGRGWSTSARFSPDRAGALQTIRDLTRILADLTPRRDGDDEPATD